VASSGKAKDAGRRAVVSVFGANDAREGDEAYETARAVGRKLAESGYAVANGGYGGTMEASARGGRRGDRAGRKSDEVLFVISGANELVRFFPPV